VSNLKVRLTDHAVEKLRVLQAHGAKVTKRKVEEVVLHPERTVRALGGRQIAERASTKSTCSGSSLSSREG
jgi:hypothetical protein